MRRLVRQLFLILTVRQRVQAGMLLVLMIVQAAVALLGVASIVPFISIVADPEIIHRNHWLKWAYERGSFTSDSAFLTFIGTATVAALLLSNGVSALTTWATQRFVASANHQLAMRLLRGYLAQPYSFFVQRNSAALHKTLLSEVTTAVNGVLMPFFGVIAQFLIVAAMAGMLLAVDPALALTIVLTLGGAYGLVYLVVRRRQDRLGQIRNEANRLRYKVAGETFGGIKDIKVLQREQTFLDAFGAPSWRLARANASNAAVSQLPHYFLESVAFGGIVVIILFYLRAGQGVAQVLPIVSLYAFTGYRMLPAIKSLFSSFVGIRFNRAPLDDLCRDLQRFSGDFGPAVSAPEPLPFSDSIRFDRVTFRYPSSSVAALHELSLRIRRNEMIGLVGRSGSGKSTLVDLLLGLYEPEGGAVTVDGSRLDAATIPAWQRQVGYVPQHIFLTDDTIARNIAFGVRPHDIDPERVQRAARIANLHGFITTLPDGYQTVVGERGVRLSGGQRQRIGVARALYNEPEVLVLDEATSALDGATEEAVLEAIGEMAGTKTIIMIAHRLSTVRDCDRIFLLEDGGVVGEGTFAELVANNLTFRALAKLEPGHREAIGADSAHPEPPADAAVKPGSPRVLAC